MSNFEFGDILAPPGIEKYGAQDPTGLLILLNNFLKIMIFAGGLFFLINMVISGIQYVGSSGNPDTTKQASSRIWMSLLGILVIAASIGLAALVGLIFFGNSNAILSPTIPEP